MIGSMRGLVLLRILAVIGGATMIAAGRFGIAGRPPERP